jgi:hypothetical protein
LALLRQAGEKDTAMFTRYAIYFTPDGALAARGAEWLGWDIASGGSVAHPDLVGVNLTELTATPRKYGFHGTIKPPFFLAEGTRVEELEEAVAELVARLPTVRLDGLQVAQLGQFLALTPLGDQTELASRAAQVVTGLDRFRAPPSATELERRRAAPLSPAQEQHLADWGYPYVMDQFRFHLTLSGQIADAKTILPIAQTHFESVLPTPFIVDSLTLAGQGPDWCFQEIHRYALMP